MPTALSRCLQQKTRTHWMVPSISLVRGNNAHASTWSYVWRSISDLALATFSNVDRNVVGHRAVPSHCPVSRTVGF